MNSRAIEEFRANSGRLGGPFEGAPMVLVHHVGRTSGRQFVSPMTYLPAPEPGTVYVFASNGGFAPNPQWYRNLVGAGAAEIEYGTQTFAVTVRELQGEERDAVDGEQARRWPGFDEYERQTAGVRVIPVLELTRVR